MDADHDAIDPEQLLAHAGWVRGLARRLVFDQARVDDVVQETWMAALGRRPRASRDTRAWLGGILRNVVRQQTRSERRLRRREQAAARAECDESGTNLMLKAEWLRILVDAVLELREPYRSTVLAVDLEGQSAASVARRLGIPAATVRSRRTRALAMLRERLDASHGDRREWSLALLPLALPTRTGTGAAPLLGRFVDGLWSTANGVLIVSTKLKLTLGVVAILGGVLLVQALQTEAPPMAAVEPLAVVAERVETGVVPAFELPAATVAVPQSLVVEEPPAGVPTVEGTNVLRVVLEGITEEDARLTTVTLTGVDERVVWPAEIRDSWPCHGLTSEFDLDPFFPHALELEVEVDHPDHLSERTRIPLSRGVELANGKTVYEVRVRLALPEFWPEFTLAVRDAHTGAHLDDIELVSGPGMTNFTWGHNPIRSSLADGLSSPVALMGGRDADEPEVEVPYLGLRPAAGESPRLVKIAHYMSQGHGVILYARAPGYAWGSIALDLSKSEPRELLLKPGSAIDVRLTNVQLERYRALETKPMLCVQFHFEPLDETLATEGLRLHGLKPGVYAVTVELDGGSWAKRPVLAREEVSLAAGETRELVLALTDPPAPPDRVTVGGVVSLPAFDGVEDVRLQLYPANWGYGVSIVELSLADMVRAGGALPTWVFQLEDVPVGTCQIRLLPFLKSWMIDVPDGGREDVELVIPELAEVLVETVDARTGERIPLEKLRYVYEQDLPGRVHNIWSDQIWTGFDGEPGLFRVWMAPGAGYVTTWDIPSELGYAGLRKDLELVPGLQSVRLELVPPCLIHFEILVDGAAPRVSDEIWEWVHYGTLKYVRAVDHTGHSRGRVGKQLTEVSAPGIYEISFEGLTKDLFHPIPLRRVDVRAGETTEVIVQLHRK